MNNTQMTTLGLIAALASACAVAPADFDDVPLSHIQGEDPSSEPVEPAEEAQEESPLEVKLGGQPISTLAVRCYISPESFVLADCIDDAAKVGRIELDTRFTISQYKLKEPLSIRSVVKYEECLFTSLDFAQYDSGGGELLKQTATFLPTIKQCKN